MQVSALARKASSTRERSSRGDATGELGHAPAQGPDERHRLVARVHVHDALLAGRHDRHEAHLARRGVAVVLELEVLAHRAVDDRALDAEQPADLVGAGRIRRRRDGEDGRVPEGTDHLGQVEVGGALAGSGAGGVVRLVDDEEARAPRAHEADAVDREELRGGEHDVELAGGIGREGALAGGVYRLAGEHRRPDPQARA